MTPIDTAFNQAFQIRWQGTEYGENSIKPMMDVTLRWFKEWDLVSLDGLSSGDIVDYQTFLRNRGCSPSQINKYLSMLAMVLVEALRARPPLTTNTMVIPRVKVPKKMQWWLRPEQLPDVYAAASEGLQGRIMQDLIGVMVHNGLRVREGLALRADMIDLRNMTVQVPGTKTAAASRTIPIYASAHIAMASIKGYNTMASADYAMVADLWNAIKGRCGITHKDATLRALRRTFAAYATTAGMPTATLKDVMGHENITTTERYLNLVGNGRLEESRRYMTGPNLIHTYDGVQVSQSSAAIVNMLEQKGASRESILQLLQEING